MIKAIGRKIETALSSAKPPVRRFEILAAETGLDDTYVIRIITPSWAKIDKAKRIDKVESYISHVLTQSDRERIFRISVLTPQEWDNIRPDLIVSKMRKIGGSKAPATSISN